MATSAQNPGRPPQQRAERTRRAILDAALRVIARRGAGRSTFRDVADEAETSPGVVTYHFPNRRDLLTAAFAHHLDETDRRGQAFVSNATSCGRAAAGSVDAVVELLRALVEDERDSFLASHELTLEMARDPELFAHVRGSLAAHRTLVERMVAATGSAHADLDAEILSAAFQGLALKWIAHRDDPAFEPRLRRAVARLLALLD